MIFSISLFFTSCGELPIPHLAGLRKHIGVTKPTALASEKGEGRKSPRNAGAGVVAGGEDTELANPPGFPELPKLNSFSFAKVNNQETFLSLFLLLR